MKGGRKLETPISGSASTTAQEQLTLARMSRRQGFSNGVGAVGDREGVDLHRSFDTAVLLPEAPSHQPAVASCFYLFNGFHYWRKLCSYPRENCTGAAILTLVTVSLTLYTFWAVRRGQDFSFLGPFLFAGLMVLMVFMLIQIFFPLGRLSQTIYGGLAALLFSAIIVYDTNNLIKRFSYDEYIAAAISLYLDIVNLFVSLLTIFRAQD